MRVDDPPRLGARLLAVRGGVRAARREQVAAGHARRADRRRDGRGGGGAPARARGGPLRRTEIEALARQAAARRRSACGSTSSARRRPARGSAAAPTSTPPPRTGSAPPPARRARRGRRRAPRAPLPRAFGPASRADIARWAGLRSPTIAPAVERLALRRFASEGGDELSICPRAPLPPADTAGAGALPPDLGRDAARPRPARADPPEAYRPRIFHTKNPQSVPTFLVDGAVAGTWRYDAGRIDLEPFHRLDRATTRALREEAGRLAAFHA